MPIASYMRIPSCSMHRSPAQQFLHSELEVVNCGCVHAGSSSLANLLMEQVEFANVIVMNKMDLMPDDDEEAIGTVMASLSLLNRKATIVFATQCCVQVKEVIASKRFDLQVRPLLAVPTEPVLYNSPCSGCVSIGIPRVCNESPRLPCRCLCVLFIWPFAWLLERVNLLSIWVLNTMLYLRLGWMPMCHSMPGRHRRVMSG